MKKNLDTIKFESRSELQSLIKVVDKYVAQNPKEKESEDLKHFFDLLDAMEMEW